jgi:phage terminase large subunit-like protein
MATTKTAKTPRKSISKKKTVEPTPVVDTRKDPVTAWANLVVDGKVVAGPHIRNACRRHLKDIDHAHERGLYWDLDAALKAINFFPDVLRLNGGQFEGNPFHLHASQAFKTGSLFGWKRADGTRRFRRAYIEEGKGNGKSPWAAGTGMYCLLADNEPRAEIYAAGKDKDQAMVLFRDAVAMSDQSPALASRLTKSGGPGKEWNLADLKTASFFRPITGDVKSGPRPYVALCDEIHEHPSRAVIEMLERGFKFRRQPLLVMITNSGSDRNTVCYQEHEAAVKAAAGTRTPDAEATFVYDNDSVVAFDDMFSFVCSLDLNDDPLKDPLCWAKANPLLDVTITKSYLAGVVRQAKAIPGTLNGILRLHFCVWTDADESWMSRAALEEVLADFDPYEEHAGKEVCEGLDLSAAQDLTAKGYIVQTGVCEEEGHQNFGKPLFDAWVEAYTPEDTLAARALRDKAPYDVWVEQGWLNAIPGQSIRLDYIAASIANDSSVFVIKALAYDRYGYRKLSQELDDIGQKLNEVEHPQGGRKRAKPTDAQVQEAKDKGQEAPLGLWMPGSIKEFESLIFEKRIRIRKSPVIISAIMSAALERDPLFDNYWFSKRKATNRIDPVVALAMAIGAATSNVVPVSGPSIYETRGFLEL